MFTETPLADPPDALSDLARRAQGGDRDAFAALAGRCRDMIYRWALVKTGDGDDAEDVTQEVLVRLHDKLRQFRGDAQFSTWLYRITRNAAGGLFRGRRRRERAYERFGVEAAVTGSREPDVTSLVEMRDTASILQAFFDELPERQREVFDLVDLQNLPARQVADMLALAPATVRAHLLRARRYLRRRLLEAEPTLAEEPPGARGTPRPVPRTPKQP
jgi:RNA polymerase sigma-70 factor (ECF subfamily)